MPFEFPDDGPQKGVLWRHVTSANWHVARSPPPRGAMPLPRSFAGFGSGSSVLLLALALPPATLCEISSHRGAAGQGSLPILVAAPPSTGSLPPSSRCLLHAQVLHRGQPDPLTFTLPPSHPPPEREGRGEQKNGGLRRRRGGGNVAEESARGEGLAAPPLLLPRKARPRPVTPPSPPPLPARAMAGRRGGKAEALPGFSAS